MNIRNINNAKMIRSWANPKELMASFSLAGKVNRVT